MPTPEPLSNPRASFERVIAPGALQVWRCTEAIDPRAGFTFRTIGNREGRCVEIVAPQNSMLMDRRLARQMALAILDIAGPEEELDSDLAQAEVVEIVYGADDRSGVVIGFKPYTPRTSSSLTDAAAFVDKVRADAGLPPSRLFADHEARHGA